MSARNSLAAKRRRRRARQIRHVGGCAICGDKVVEYVDEQSAPDPSYRAVCRVHLGYAVATIFGGGV